MIYLAYVHVYASVPTYTSTQAECTQSVAWLTIRTFRVHADHGLLQQLQYVLKTLHAEICGFRLNHDNGKNMSPIK